MSLKVLNNKQKLALICKKNLESVLNENYNIR